MELLYNLTAHIIYFMLKIYGLFNRKMSLFINGRKEIFTKLSTLKKDDKTIWFHTASLGEFEQGRPIIESVKLQFPTHKIILTFFSPSGYEIRKDHKLADVVCYLPFDTKNNAKKFVKKAHPKLTIIIKYEFWPNVLRELKNKKIPTILVSGIFRKNQSFFQFYGSWIRKSLQTFDHFFVQNESSKKLLNSINFKNITVSGDTRFDRVSEILQQDNSLNFISSFKNNQYMIVAGSTWKEDEKILVNYINNQLSKNEKIVIAPHNINQKSIKELQKSIQKNTVLFSEKEFKNLSEYQVFIIDTVGLLTKIYSYADVAYVGGGLSSGGLHNILESATFGIPIVFGGNNYKKFKEATDLIALNGCKIIINQDEFYTILAQLRNDINLRVKMGSVNKNYIKDNVGASQIILHFISNLLNHT